MEVWGFMEMIHSRSYTYIIKNVYSDPSEVFDKIVTDDRILERISSVTESYDDFINCAQTWGVVICGKADWKDSPTIKLGSKRCQTKTLWKQSPNVNILEGIRFYVSFSCSFAFGELKLMEGSAKIISLIARDENQHLAITQNILNKWRSGDDPEMKEIMKEEEEWTYAMFDRAVNEEKRWYDYLFKDGSMIGLNDKLLQQYVEWIVNRRLKGIGLKPVYDISARTIPFHGPNTGSHLRVYKLHSQETEVESYVVGGIKQDVKKDTFSGFKL